MLVDAAVGFGGDGGADNIGHGEDGVAFALGLAGGGERVDRLPRLAHDEEERVAQKGRVAVAKLGGLVAFNGDAGETFDHVLGDHAGVERGAARAEHEAFDAAEFPGRAVEAAKVGGGAVRGKAAAHGVLEGDRLLENRLIHEVGVGAPVGVGDVPCDVVNGRVDRFLVKGRDAEIPGG